MVSASKLVVAGGIGLVGAVIAVRALRGRLVPVQSAKVPSNTSGTAVVPFEAPTELANSESVVVCGTLLLCTQNLAVSGANQVLLNLVEGSMWPGNIVLVSPSNGPFAKEFSDLGVAVRVGTLREVLVKVTDVRLAICNTIMTAHNVISLGAAGIPQMWILHEWWPEDMLVNELTKRNDKNTTPEIVAEALQCCQRTVCVCRSQLDLYKPKHGAVTFVGVPMPRLGWQVGATKRADTVTFLCLGIVCPRKNQHWAVEIFKQWAGDRKDVRLLVVGARYVRQYEIDYVEKVKSIIDGDARIELHEVTNDVDAYYRQSDALLFTSLNEVTPMVIAEAMMRGLPVLTTDIAGIPEMLTHGVHGYVLPPNDKEPFVQALDEIGATDADGQRRRLQMGAAARKHAIDTFTNAGMVSNYRAAALAMAAPIVLVDMDGVLVDWDRGFVKAWGGRAPIDRTLSYAMEDCVPPQFKEQAQQVFHAKGFFLGLPPMEGGVAALRALAAKGYRVYLCTSPVLTSSNCAGEKFEWIRTHLGQAWVSRIILTSDKTAVRGDVLIDDKAHITGTHHPVWKHLLFTAPYNRHVNTKPRLTGWEQCEEKIAMVLKSGGSMGRSSSSVASLASNDDDDGMRVSKKAIAAMPDFSHLLPADYRKDYAAWRGGQPSGAKGELHEAIQRMQAMQDSVLNNMSEDFTEVQVFRTGYAQWRRGRSKGAKSKGAAEHGTFSQL